MLTLTYETPRSIGQIATLIGGGAYGDSRRRGGLHITKQPVHGASQEVGSVERRLFSAD